MPPTGFHVWVLVVSILVLAGFVKVRVSADYGEAGFRVKAGPGPFALTVYPRRKKKKKAGKEEKKENIRAPGDFERFKSVLETARASFGVFLRGLVVDELEVDFTAASEDPAEAAMMYGLSAAGIGGLLPAMEKNLTIRREKIRIYVDFSRNKPVIRFCASLSVPLWRILAFGARFIILYPRDNKRTINRDKVV